MQLKCPNSNDCINSWKWHLFLTSCISIWWGIQTDNWTTYIYRYVPFNGLSISVCVKHLSTLATSILMQSTFHYDLIVSKQIRAENSGDSHRCMQRLIAVGRISIIPLWFWHKLLNAAQCFIMVNFRLLKKKNTFFPFFNLKDPK